MVVKTRGTWEGISLFLYFVYSVYSSILLSVVTFLDLVDLASVTREWGPEKTEHEGWKG